MKYLATVFRISAGDGESVHADGMTAAARDVLASLAADAGYEAFEEVAGGIKGYVQADLFDKEALDNIIETFPITGVTIDYSMEEIADKDYNETWESVGFEPIVINGKIVVHDTLHVPADVPADAIDIVIDAKQAFGTGTHETTRMIVSRLAGMTLRGKDVLDCGCGTGILSIAASKLGARHVTGYDIDEWSVRNTMHNAALNHVDNVRALHGDAHVIGNIGGAFDIVMANINRNILLSDMPAMRGAMSPNGVLMLSGFYDDDASMLVSKAETIGLRCVDEAVDNRWCLLLLVPADA